MIFRSVISLWEVAVTVELWDCLLASPAFRSEYFYSSNIQTCNLKMNFKGEEFSACVVNHNQAITLGLFGGKQRTSITSTFNLPFHLVYSSFLQSFGFISQAPNSRRVRLYHCLTGMLVCASNIPSSAKLAGGPCWVEVIILLSAEPRCLIG